MKFLYNMYKRNCLVLEYVFFFLIIYFEFIVKFVLKFCVYVILYDWVIYFFDLWIYIVVKYWYKNIICD